MKEVIRLFWSTIEVSEVQAEWCGVFVSVPGRLNSEVYRAVSEFASSTPPLIHHLTEIGTEAGLLFFALAFLVGWWQARKESTRSMALALLAPAVTVFAYMVSEFVKSVFHVARPCRVMPDVSTIAECPPVGDWSLPSNHATIIAACAVAIVYARPRSAVLVLPVAALLAISRVFVGVHYPVDVVAGIALGASVALLLLLTLTPVASAVIGHVRFTSFLRFFLYSKRKVGRQRPTS